MLVVNDEPLVPVSTRRDAWQSGILVGVLLCALYVYTCAPDIALAHDTGELITCTLIQGVPHSPGYPLYTAMTSVWDMIFPFGNPAWRQNVFTALSVGLAGGFLAAGLAIFYGRLPAIVGALLFGMSSFVWRQAVGAEVFGLHLCFLCLLVWLAALWEGANDERRRYLLHWTSFVLGCCLAHHHIIVFAAPPMILFGLMQKGKGRPWGFSLLNLPILLSAWLGPYYLQMKLSQNRPGINWADPSSIKACWHHFLRKSYGTGSLNISSLENDERAGRAHVSGFYLSLLRSQFPLPEPLLVLFGIDSIIMHRQLARGILFGGIALMYGPIFSMVGNQPTHHFFFDLLERFYASSMVGFGGLAAMGVYSIQCHWRGTRRRVAVAAVALMPLLSLASNWDRAAQRGQAQAYDHVMCQMSLMPQNAMYLCMGDLNCGIANYQVRALHHFPQMKLVLPGLVVSDWYTANLWPPIAKAAESTIGEHHEKINAMMKYCHEHNIPVVSNYWEQGLQGEIVDYGMFYVIVPDAQHRPDDATYHRQLQILFDQMIAWPKRGELHPSWKKNFWHNYFCSEWARCFDNMANLLQSYDPVRARKALDQVLEMTEYPELRHWLNHGLLSYKLGDYDTARRDGLEILRNQPDNIYATALMVDIAIAERDNKQARIWERRLLELNAHRQR